MTSFAQLNVKVESEWIDEVERLADEHAWSKAQTIRVAIRTLAEVMSKHADAPRFTDDVTRALYMRVSREIPGQLVEVSRSVEFLPVGDVAVIRAEGWLIWEDAATGELLAREEAGEQRFGRIRKGRIEVMTSPIDASRN